MKSLRGSVFWMAPEVFHGNGYGKTHKCWTDSTCVGVASSTGLWRALNIQCHVHQWTRTNTMRLGSWLKALTTLLLRLLLYVCRSQG